MDSELRLIKANPMALRMLGDLPSGVIGSDFPGICRQIWERDHANEVVRIFQRTLATGEPYKNAGRTGFRIDRQTTERHEWRLERIELDDGRFGLICYLREISQQPQTRDAFQANEERRTFLLELSDLLREARDPVQIQDDAARKLAELLDVQRVVYFRLGQDEYIIEREFLRGAQSIQGPFPLSEFGRQRLTQYQGGRVASCDDTLGQNGFSQAELKSFSSNQIRAYIGVPFIKAGQLYGGMGLHCTRARQWKPDEIALVEEAALRTWNAIERATAESALRKSEARLGAALEGGRMGLWEWDIPGGISIWNPVEYQILGLPVGNGIVPSSLFIEITHPDDRDRLTKAIDRVIQSRTDFYDEVRIVRRDNGKIRWVACAGQLKFDANGSPVRMIGVNYDVTERRLAQEHQRLLTEAAGVLLSTDDPDAMLRRLFQKIAPHFELDAYLNFIVDDSGTGLRLNSYSGITDEHIGAVATIRFGQAICGLVAETRQTCCASSIQESEEPRVQLVRSLGFRVYACNPLIANGTLLGTLSFASKSRDDFGTEERAFLTTICHYVSAAYERLRLVERLRDTDRRKDEFLATLAHELRNPLAPIRYAVRHIQRKSEHDPELSSSSQVIDRQISQMSRLLDDLMDVNRITRNKVDLRRETVTLSSILESALETCRPMIDVLGHDVAQFIPAQPIYIHGDRMRLAQIFANLLNNAAKYTEPRGHIRIEAVETANAIVVSIADSGIGISAEALPRIFDMFAQEKPAIERSQGGLGIGLALVKGLVRLHDGSVEAQSEGPGRGSTFTVRLPIVSKSRSESPSSSVSSGARSRQRKIVIADDNEDSARMLSLLLRGMGHQVCVAFDGEEALRLISEEAPHIALLDIGMPKRNGYEVARSVRTQSQLNVKLVALTGWGQEEDKRRALDAGFDTHMVKPVDVDALVSLIE